MYGEQTRQQIRWCTNASTSLARRYEAAVEMRSDPVNPLTDEDLDKLAARFPERWADLACIKQLPLGGRR